MAKTLLTPEYWEVFKRCIMLAKLADANRPVVENKEFAKHLYDAGILPSPDKEDFIDVYHYFLMELKRNFIIDSVKFSTTYVDNDDYTIWPFTHDHWMLTSTGKHVLETEVTNKVWLDMLNEHNRLREEALRESLKR